MHQNKELHQSNAANIQILEADINQAIQASFASGSSTLPRHTFHVTGRQELVLQLPMMTKEQ